MTSAVEHLDPATEFHRSPLNVLSMPVEDSEIGDALYRDGAAWEDLLGFGEQYSKELKDIIESDDPAKAEYIRTIGYIAHMAGGVSRAFPDRYQFGVKTGMQKLTADALFAVADHMRNGGTTEADLPLNNGSSSLSLRLKGGEPLGLLKGLQVATDNIAPFQYRISERVQTTAKMRAVKTSTSQDYGMYRFYGYSGFYPASVYIRPYGDVTYDPKLEYGKPGEGVEGSISYVVDMSSPKDYKFVEIGKHQGKDDDHRISIRLDREGIKPADRMNGAKKDPTQKEGTLSLDVGSVLGGDDWTSTKLGRFLAWGNVLRSRQEGGATHLNHMTEFFTQEDGDADVFALQAARMIEVLDARCITKAEASNLYVARTAVKRTLQ